MAEPVTIGLLNSPEQYKICELLQQDIWQADPVEVVPADLLITAQRHGGLVLGAFDDKGNMVGCLFGFPGNTSLDNPLTRQFSWQHCSHIMGVIKEWRGRGVGYLLKIAQRNWALKQGYKIITWTYNPLESANAILNITKLGARCACYLRNVYGELPDGLNAGVLSDRFEVVWEIDSERVGEKLSSLQSGRSTFDINKIKTSVLNPGQLGRSGWLEPTKPMSPIQTKVLVEFPYDFQKVKEYSLDLAISWQLNMRQTCEEAFSAGYIVSDVLKAKDGSINWRAYYLLELKLESDQ